VSAADDVLLGRAELEGAFTALGGRLARRGVVADIFVVGGAAMALAYDATRVTRDVDARFVPHGIVLEEARQVADDLGLPPWRPPISPARMTPGNAACLTIQDCASWQHHQNMSLR
jgi:hypothetical protein